jgi:hypothetical protein
MRRATHAIAIFAAVAATTALADEGGASGRRASPAAKPSWAFGLTAYPTVVRGGDDYTSAIAVADRGALPPRSSAGRSPAAMRSPGR